MIHENEVVEADAFDAVSELPDDRVNMSMFAPPKWGSKDQTNPKQIGQEDQVGEYIAHIVQLCREVRRVLRPEGSLWLSVSDGYVDEEQSNTVPDDASQYLPDSQVADIGSGGCKMLLPHRIGIALIDDGWLVRNDIIWKKPSTQSNSDRLSNSFNVLFHLVDQQEYYYDLDAIKEPKLVDREERGYDPTQSETIATLNPREPTTDTRSGKNPGDIIETVAADGADPDDSYPEKVCTKPVKATCPETVCANCGSPETWDCRCDTDLTKPGIVLDPMCGRGTTCNVAANLGRRYIGADIDPEKVADATAYIADSRQGNISEYI